MGLGAGSRIFSVVLLLALAAVNAGAAEWTSSVGPDTEEVLPPGSSEPQTLRFGEAVSIHGSMALAGMPSFDGARGRVAVFTRSTGGEWIRSGTLSPSDLIEGDAFGQGVALRGRFAVVSSGRAVYVFYLAQHWQQIQKLPITAANAWFNSAIDFEIPFLVVGGGAENAPGAAYLFQFDPEKGKFQRLGRFIAPTGSSDEGFGESVAIWNGVVAVGAPGYNGGQGTAYVFRKVAGRWVRQQLLNGMGEALDGYGASIDVRGTTLAIGAPDEDRVGPLGTETLAGGAVHILKYNGTHWVPSQRLRPTASQSAWYLEFGSNLQLQGDRLAVAAPFGETRFDPGLVFLYSRSTGSYLLTDSFTSEPSLGSGLSLSQGALMAGVPFDPLFSIGYALIHEFGAPAP